MCRFFRIFWNLLIWVFFQPRNSKQLKNKYEAIKKELKKKHSQYKCYLNGTGGGKFVPPPTPSTEDEKALSETIAISIEGLQSQYDSDGTAGTYFGLFTVLYLDTIFFH